MAENFYTTRTETPDPFRGRDEAFRSASAAANTALAALLQGKNEKDAINAKSASAKDALATLLKMRSEGQLPPGASASLNGASFGQDPSAHILAQQQKGNSNALKSAQGIYNKGAANVEKTIGPIKEMLEAVNDPNNPSAGGLAKTLAIRLQGMNRYNRAEGGNIFPEQLGNKMTNFVNSLTSGGNNPLTEAQKAEANQMALNALKSAQEYHGRIKDNALSAYNLDPYHTAEGVGQLQNSLGAPLDKALQDIHKKYSGMVSHTSGPNLQPQEPGQSHGILGKVGDALSSFFNPKPAQTAPVASGATPQLQMPSFDDFKKWKASQSAALQQKQAQDQQPGYAYGGVVEDDSPHEESKPQPKPSPSPDKNSDWAVGRWVNNSDPDRRKQASDSMKKAFGYKDGGKVPGHAHVEGNSPENDTVKAKLSPGEGVIDRETLEDEGLIGHMARAVLQHIQEKNKRR